MIEVINGDLIHLAEQHHFDAIAHGCNCFHTMGSGVAAAVQKYTNGEALRADKLTSFGDINKMGTFSQTKSPDGKVDVYNLYTQFVYASQSHDLKDATLVHWRSVVLSLSRAVKDGLTARPESEFMIGIPEIGCGLAGGSTRELASAVCAAQDIVIDAGYDESSFMIFIVAYQPTR